MIKYPDYLDSLEYPKEYGQEKLKYTANHLNLFQDTNSITEDLLTPLSDQCLCFLYSRLESDYNMAYVGEEEDRAKKPYLICQKELKKRGII